jgi:hypothetical protein
MKIIAEALVDWQPLQIRFFPRSKFEAPGTLVRCLESWFQTNASRPRSDCDIRYWNVTREDPALVEAVCEHLTNKALKRLAQHLAKRCPELDRIVIGETTAGAPVVAAGGGLSFDWAPLPAATVDLNGARHIVEAVAISFTPVTLGQFTQFLDATGYTPVPDKLEYADYLISHFQLNHGKSPKLPLFGVTHDDAVAFCEWAGLRLPSEPELQHFFVSMIQEGRQFKWSGACWTSTAPAPDTFIVRDGPYRAESLREPLDSYRKTLHRQHYQYLEAPCFRVARTLT